MLTCQALQQFSLEKPPAVMLGRSPEVQSKYDRFMEEKRNKCDFIEKMKENLKGKKFHFVINDFYHTVRLLIGFAGIVAMKTQIKLLMN